MCVTPGSLAEITGLGATADVFISVRLYGECNGTDFHQLRRQRPTSRGSQERRSTESHKSPAAYQYRSRAAGPPPRGAFDDAIQRVSLDSISPHTAWPDSIA